MVEFGGWDMPVEYSGVGEEHLAVRTRAGLFDVSHMGEIELAGRDALAAVQKLTSNDASRLAHHQAQLASIGMGRSDVPLALAVRGVSSKQQFLDRELAIVGCARSRQIVTIYLIQTLWLGLAGGLMGVALGAFVQKMFPVLIRQVFDLLPEVSWDWSFSLQGLAVGVLATLLFTLPPIVGVWHVRPSLVFRREMDDASRKPAWQSPAYLVCLAAIAAGFIAISLWLSGSWKVSGYFVGGLAASLVLLGLAASLLLRSARWIVRRSGRKLPASFRHGFANLYRPGTHAASILVALGVGVVFTTTTYLIQKTIIRDVETGAPARSGNVYLLDIRPGQRDEVAKFIAAQPGVEKPPDLVGYFAPHEGSATTAYGVYHIQDLAAYEGYRSRLRDDPLGRENYAFSQRERFIRREDRLFLRNVSAPHAPLAKS